MFTAVDWSKRGEYITKRKGISVTVANEALSDPNRLVIDPDPASKSGEGVRIIGWSSTFGGLVTVIVVLHEGREYGSNAWRTEGSNRRNYWETER